jgi:hypothetical protein
MCERERSPSQFDAFVQMLAHLLGALERSSLAGDLALELGPAVAVPPVEVLELPLGGGELLGSALTLAIELLPLLARPVEDRVAPLSALVEREWFRGRAFEGEGGTLGRCGRVGLTERRLAFEQVAVGEVEAGLEASPAAGDVAPLLQGALVGEEDEGAVDGEVLGGVAGERVAVVEMFGSVGEDDVPVDAGLVANDEASVVEVDDGAAHAVAESEAAVVTATEGRRRRRFLRRSRDPCRA